MEEGRAEVSSSTVRMRIAAATLACITGLAAYIAFPHVREMGRTVVAHRRRVVSQVSVNVFQRM